MVNIAVAVDDIAVGVGVSSCVVDVVVYTVAILFAVVVYDVAGYAVVHIWVGGGVVVVVLLVLVSLVVVLLTCGVLLLLSRLVFVCVLFTLTCIVWLLVRLIL